jgi:molybdenum cofactor cytidylyltransferase
VPHAIVLAAGQATRFGGDKLVALIRGAPLIRRTIEHVLESAVDGVTVVIAPGASGDLVRAALQGLRTRFTINAHAAEGLSTSVRAGIDALAPTTDAVVIALGDQPDIDPQVIDQLIARWRETGAAIVVPTYDDGRGNPALFDARMFPELRQLEGDVGARPLLARDPTRVERVTVSHAAPRDVDTRDDLRALDVG